MKWTKADLANYLGSEEYVDTVIVPLIPFQFSKDREMKKDASHAELLTLLAIGIEQELAGRVMLTPSYYYVKNAIPNEIERLKTWSADIQTKPFSHIFYLTFDAGWKKEEHALEGTLLWFPALFDNGQNEVKEQMSGQIEQIVDLIRSFWVQ